MRSFRMSSEMRKAVIRIAAIALVALGIVTFLKKAIFSSEKQLHTMAMNYGIVNYFVLDGVLHDDIELSLSYKSVVVEIEAHAIREADLAGIHGQGRFLFLQESKKKLLKEKYNITWRSIVEMNPWVVYN